MSDTRQWIVTGTSMVVEADSWEEAIERSQETSGWHWEVTEVVAVTLPEGVRWVDATSRAAGHLRKVTDV